jgi:hypothetical protein
MWRADILAAVRFVTSSVDADQLTSPIRAAEAVHGFARFDLDGVRIADSDSTGAAPSPGGTLVTMNFRLPRMYCGH